MTMSDLVLTSQRYTIFFIALNRPDKRNAINLDVWRAFDEAVQLANRTFGVRLFLTLFQANMLLAVFNLLPVPPLDGFKVFGVVLQDKWYGKLLQYERFIGIAFLFIVFFFRGVLTTVLGWILVPFNYVIQYPITWLFQQLQAALGLPVMPMFL